MYMDGTPNSAIADYISFDKFVKDRCILIPRLWDTWRAVREENQYWATISSIPNKGQCIPRITDGIHTIVEFVDGSVLEVHALNIVYDERIPERIPVIKVKSNKPDRTKVKIDEAILDFT